MRNVYIACGLTHVPEALFDEYVGVIHGIADAVRNAVPDITTKYALVDSDPQLARRDATDKARLCYLWDRKMVEDADLLIAEASFPSTGLGIELQIAEMHDKAVILMFRDYGCNRAPERHYNNPNDKESHVLQIGEGFVTLMALGLPSIFRTIQYSDLQDGIHQLGEAIALLERE